MVYKDLITDSVLNEINTKLQEQGTCLRIVEDGIVVKDIKSYKLRIRDKFIDSDSMIPNPNKECEEFIRNFFKERGIRLPYSNQVLDIWAYTIDEE